MVKLTRFFEKPGNKIAKELDDMLYVNNIRHYLGYSSSGDSCKRKIWYNFHWTKYEELYGRKKRIFDLGHLLEDYIVENLQFLGYSTIDRQKEVSDETGHILGHIDGVVIISGEKYLLEIKTANEKSFSAIEKHGVKLGHNSHYMQMQAYMGKLNLESGLYVCYNKNTSEYYTEFVSFNPGVAKDIDRMLFSILTSEQLPERVSDESDWFECLNCQFLKICHFNDNNINKNCRTCSFVSIEMQGKWSCSKWNKELTIKEQMAGCECWKINPEFTRS